MQLHTATIDYDPQNSQTKIPSLKSLIGFILAAVAYHESGLIAHRDTNVTGESPPAAKSSELEALRENMDCLGKVSWRGEA